MVVVTLDQCLHLSIKANAGLSQTSAITSVGLEFANGLVSQNINN